MLETSAHRSSGSLAAEISNLLVRLVSDFTGRGPTEARTYLQDDLITVVLRNALTKGERSLIESGAADHVLRTRRLIQQAMRQDVVAAVERLTGRRVVAMLSANSADPDIMVENLLLDGPAYDPVGA